MAMLINNFRKIPYIKIGADRDFCIICAMKKKITPDRDIYETERSLQGKLTNKPMIYLNQRGFEQCICMDCIKEIAKEYTDLIEPTTIEKATEKKTDETEKVEDNKSGQAVDNKKGKGKNK